MALSSNLRLLGGRQCVVCLRATLSRCAFCTNDPEYVLACQVRFDDLWAFDIHSAAWTLLEPDGARPPPRAHHTATFIESTSTHPARLLIFGGYGGYRGARTFFSDLFCLDLESMVWTPIQALGDAPPPRADHAACLIDGKFLAIFGGRSTSEYFNDIHILQVDTMQWTTHKKMGNPHHWLALCSHCVEVRP